MIKHKCDYGCGKEGTFYLKTADKWSCSKNFRSCEGYRKTLSSCQAIRNKNSRISKLKLKVKNGEVKCHYCGNTAKYVISGFRGCCGIYAKHCPEYSKVIGDNIRQSYIDDPSKHEKMTKAMLKCQNRPNVIKKKRKSMTKLHKQDCNVCVEFQHNYEKGRDTFRETLHNRHSKSLSELGVPDKHIPVDIKERVELLKLLRYKKALNMDRFKLKGSINNKVILKESV